MNRKLAAAGAVLVIGGFAFRWILLPRKKPPPASLEVKSHPGTVIFQDYQGFTMPKESDVDFSGRGARAPEGSEPIYEEYRVPLAKDLLEAPESLPPATHHVELVCRGEGDRILAKFERCNGWGPDGSDGYSMNVSFRLDGAEPILSTESFMGNVKKGTLKRVSTRHGVFRLREGSLTLEEEGEPEPGVRYYPAKLSEMENGTPVTRYFLAQE